MKLYEITGEILELLTMAEDLELDQETIQDTMEGLDFEFEEKAEAYAKVIKTMEMDIAGLDAEIQYRPTEKVAGRRYDCNWQKKIQDSAFRIWHSEKSAEPECIG